MKNFKFLAVALALVMGLAACEVEPEFGSKITLGSGEVNIPSDGAAVTVGYKIDTPIEGEKIGIEHNADWLTVNTEKARTIELSATINDTGADRSAELLISYKGAQSVKLLVKQQCYTAPFIITLNSVGATDVTASVKTSDDMTWIYWVQSKEYVEYWMETGEEGLFQQDLEYLEYTAGNMETTLEEMLGEILVTGSYDGVQQGRLQPETEYVLYVYGMTTDGRRTTSIVTEGFKTTAAHTGDLTFEFEVTEKNYRIDFTITPSHLGVPYYFGIASQGEIDEWMETYDTTDLRTAIQKGDIDYNLQYFLDLGWYENAKEYYDFWTETDVMDYGFIDADADTKYIIYAAKWNEECEFTGALSTYEYTTKPVGMSSNVITLTVEDITQSSVCVSATATNDDPYVVIPVKSSEIAGMSDKNIIAHLKSNYEYLMGEYTYEGALEDEVYNYMRPDTDYTILYFGYIAGTQTTKMGRYEFKTLASGNPADCTFDFYVLPDAEDAWVEITPSDKGHYYHWMIYPADCTAENAKIIVKQIVDEYFEGDYAAFASWELSQGDEAQTAYDLYPQTEYKVGAIIMNYDKFEFLSDMIFSEPFTTPEIAYADIEIVFKYGPYYDLEALVAAGATEFEKFLKTDDAVFPVTIELEGDYGEFYYDIWSSDLTDTEFLPDASCYNALYEGSPYFNTNFLVPYDKDMTIMAVAYDNAAVPSHIKRELVRFTKEGAAPVEGYFDSLPAKAPMKSALAKANKWTKSAVTATKYTAEEREQHRLASRMREAQKADAKAEIENARLERVKAQKELREANRKTASLQRIPR